MTDAIIRRIERFSFPQGTVCAERRNRGYTLTDVVQIRVTRGAELTLPGRMMAPWFFQVRCEYGSMRWRGGAAGGE